MSRCHSHARGHPLVSAFAFFCLTPALLPNTSVGCALQCHMRSKHAILAHTPQEQPFHQHYRLLPIQQAHITPHLERPSPACWRLSWHGSAVGHPVQGPASNRSAAVPPHRPYHERHKSCSIRVRGSGAAGNLEHRIHQTGARTLHAGPILLRLRLHQARQHATVAQGPQALHPAEAWPKRKSTGPISRAIVHGLAFALGLGFGHCSTPQRRPPRHRVRIVMLSNELALHGAAPRASCCGRPRSPIAHKRRRAPLLSAQLVLDLNRSCLPHHNGFPQNNVAHAPPGRRLGSVTNGRAQQHADMQRSRDDESPKHPMITNSVGKALVLPQLQRHNASTSCQAYLLHHLTLF